MNKLPRAFRRDAARLATHANELIEAGKGHPQSLARTRKIARLLREFITRWQNDPNVASEHAALARFRKQLESVELHTTRLYLITLQELLEARRDWVIGELFIDLSATFADVVKHAPNSLRPELERIYREHQNQEYDPATDYRESMTTADKYEEKYRKLRQEFVENWPDFLRDPIFIRIETATPETLGPLIDELVAKVAAVNVEK